ncbi:MAG: hypothetical protein KDD84_23350 [Caldilineaceae bacterium]|nr:hypothetical protein [Caldilineaceae bacterium]
MINTQWQQVGIWRGGTVTNVLYAGGRLFAGSRAGLYGSDDGGGKWRRSGAELRDPSITALAGTDDGAHLFHATESGRLYHSTDRGDNWSDVDGWAGLGMITAIALSPDYAQDSTIFVATEDGPHRSQDGGASWEIAVFGLVDIDVLCIAVDPNFAQTETLWIGTANGGLYKSRNGGRSWRDAGDGLPDTAVLSLQAAARNGNVVLFAGTEMEGVFCSTDGGAPWRQAVDSFDVNALAVRADGLVLAGTDAGIIRSEDWGANWQASANGTFVALDIALAQEDMVFAATWQMAVSVSADSGNSWQPTETIPPFHAPPMAVRRADNRLSLADIDGDWVASDDLGASWIRAEVESPIVALVADDRTGVVIAGGELLFRIEEDEVDAAQLPCAITHVALSPNYAEDSVILVAGLDEEDGESPLLFRSDDDGEHWRELSPPWADRLVLGLRFSPHYTEDQSIYAITALPQETDYSVEIWQSADQGVTWVDLGAFATPMPVAPFIVLGDAENSLFIANGERVYRIFTSQADGTLAVSQETLPGEERITNFAVAAGGALYAATSHGIWRRDDGWRPVGNGIEDEIIVAVLPGKNDLIAVAMGGAIWLLR